MDRFLPKALLFTGLTAAIASVPGAIPFGLIAFLIPGLILMMMPTTFLWLLGFYAFYWLLRIRLSAWVASVIALLLVAVTFWFLPQHAIRANERAFDRILHQKDILPTEQVILAGNVKFSVDNLPERDFDKTLARRDDQISRSAGLVQKPRDRSGNRHENDWLAWKCDELCLALLATPGVKSVTLDAHGDSDSIGRLTPYARTFRMLPEAECLADTDISNPSESLNVDRPHCIVAGLPLQLHDMTIVRFDYEDGDKQQRSRKQGPLEWGPYPIYVNRLAITDGQGHVRLRKTFAAGQIMLAPLLLLPSGFAPGDYAIEWGRTWKRNHREHESLNDKKLLKKYTNLYILDKKPELQR